MLLAFLSNFRVDIKELEELNESPVSVTFGQTFVLVSNDAYLEFRAFFLKRLEGVYLCIFEENREICLHSCKLSVQRPDGSSLLLKDWSRVDVDVVFEWKIASSFGDLKTKCGYLANESTLNLALEVKINSSCFTNVPTTYLMQERKSEFCARVYFEMSEGISNDTDYTITCRESNKEFPCHKLILRRRSPYFANLFASHSNFDQQEVHDVDWSPEATEEILFFIYNNEKSPKFDSVPIEDLVRLAEMLQLKELLVICEKAMLANIKENNTWAYLGIAKTHKMKCLKRKALCLATEDPDLNEKLFDQGEKEELRKKVSQFSIKRGRTQRQVQ